MDPPLDPSADQARSLLRAELAKAEYNDSDLLGRILRWITRRLDRGLEYTADIPPLEGVLLTIVVVFLLAALIWLITRPRTRKRRGGSDQAVLTDENLTAAQLRARAEAALAQGRHEEALVDAFRALTVRQIERGRLEETPGATAHEVASVLGREYPPHQPPIDGSADLFDLVLYGDRPASRDQAVGVLHLDDDLATAR